MAHWPHNRAPFRSALDPLQLVDVLESYWTLAMVTSSPYLQIIVTTQNAPRKSSREPIVVSHIHSRMISHHECVRHKDARMYWQLARGRVLEFGMAVPFVGHASRQPQAQLSSWKGILEAKSVDPSTVYEEYPFRKLLDQIKETKI